MVLVACCSPEAVQGTVRAAAACIASCDLQGARDDLMREAIVSRVVLVAFGNPEAVQGIVRAATPCIASCNLRGGRGPPDACGKALVMMRVYVV